MRYQLAVLTHGPDGDDLAVAALRDARRALSLAPDRIVVFWDGAPDFVAAVQLDEEDHWPSPEVWISNPAVGFCNATIELWGHCHGYEGDYTFWLENDFEFERPVNLAYMAHALRRGWHGKLAQMSLLRHPERHELPTLVRPEWEVCRSGLPGEIEGVHFVDEFWWLEQQVYWTTNPSLIPQEIIETVEWPLGPECEGKMGALLREHGYRFGVWGHGDPWIKHVGTRTGFGY